MIKATVWIIQQIRCVCPLATRVEESEVFGWSRSRIPSRIFCPTPTPDVQLDHFLNHTLKLAIPAEMLISFETFVETDISCCAPRFPLILTAKFHSFYVKESESEILERAESGILTPTPQSCLLCNSLLNTPRYQ